VKIESVDTFLAHTYFLVRVRTDTGITGWGQSAFWGYPDACERIVSQFREYLVGKDPLQIERHWSYLFRHKPFRGGALSGAVSAVDIALWDVAGRHFQTPVYQLLGGRQRDKVRLHYLMGGDTVDELVASARWAVKEGFTAVKLDPLPSGYQQMRHARLVEEVLTRLSAVREAIGLDVDLCVEIHRKLVPAEAISLAGHLKPLRIFFYEDPILHDSMDAHAQVARKVDLPLAIGERHHTIFEFRDLLARDAVHYVRPDVGLAGGISHCKKIAALAEAYHAGVITHNFLSPLLTAASIQLDVAISNCVLQEYNIGDESPPQSDLLTQGLRREGGYIIAPEGPGLGVEVNEGFIDKYPFEPMRSRAPLHEDGSVAYH